MSPRSAAPGPPRPADGVARPRFLPADDAVFELASGLRAVACTCTGLIPGASAGHP